MADVVGVLYRLYNDCLGSSMINSDGNSNTQVDTMDRIEVYLQLSDNLYKQYHDRRALEWKVHIAVWTLLALTAYLCVTNDKHLEWCTLSENIKHAFRTGLNYHSEKAGMTKRPVYQFDTC